MRKALVYHGSGKKSLDERPLPKLVAPPMRSRPSPTRLVDTVSTPMLMKTVRARRLDPKRLITHGFTLDRILDAYDTFGLAADPNALKVIIEVS